MPTLTLTPGERTLLTLTPPATTSLTIQRVIQGVQGIQGEKGDAGEIIAVKVSRTAGENLSALRVVWEDSDGDIFYADKDSSNVFKIIGVTSTSGNTSASVDVVVSGELTDNNWAWVSYGRVYLLDSGALTQTPPTTGYLVCVGVALASNRILVKISEPILLI